MIQGFARAQRRVWLRWWLPILAVLGGSGCEWMPFGQRGPRPETLVAIETRVAPGATIGADTEGRVWVAAGDSLWGFEAATGRRLARGGTGAEGAIHMVGEAGGWLYLRAGERLLALEAATGEVRGERRQPESLPVALDPRGRHLYAGTASGAVYGLDPATLEPLWAWPRLGVETTALASSPEADRLYQALAHTGDGGSSGARLLGRDVQTGRLVTEDTLAFALHSLATDADGTLYGLAGEGSQTAVAALQPGPGGVRVLWHRSLAGVGVTGPAELRVSPRGGRLALLSRGLATGVHLLDAESGAALGRLSGEVLAATFGMDGALYLLAGDEIRVLR